MCNLSDAVFEDGMVEGMRLGDQQGLQKGILLSITNLMNSQQIDIQKAMEMLCIPIEDQPLFIELVNKMQ